MGLVCICVKKEGGNLSWEIQNSKSRTKITLVKRPEKAMATHSSTLAWKIPWTEEPCGLQSMGSLRVRHNWATSLSLFTFMHWRRKWQPSPVFLPGESQGRGSLVGCRVWGCTESDTTKGLSRSSCSSKETKREWTTEWFRLFEEHTHTLFGNNHGLWAFLMAQTVENLPAMQETWVQSLGWEDPLEEGMAIYLSILAWESHGQKSLVGYSSWGCKESDHDWGLTNLAF